MKYVKKQSLNRSSPMNDQFSVTSDDNIITNSSASLQVPTGLTAQRPSGASLASGTVRFNTTLNEFEVYNDYLNPPVWEVLRTVRPAVITPQNLGYGNYNDTIFGPLSYDVDINTPQNILVFVDNVYQMPTTNYTLIENPTASTSTLAVSTSSGVTTLYLSTLTEIDAGNSAGWRTVSAATGIQANTTVTSVSNVYDSVFNGWPVGISLPTDNSITAGTVISFGYSTGVYIEFTGVVPAKPVFVLMGFDGYYRVGL